MIKVDKLKVNVNFQFTKKNFYVFVNKWELILNTIVENSQHNRQYFKNVSKRVHFEITLMSLLLT